jgi:hypothetical protein
VFYVGGVVCAIKLDVTGMQAAKSGEASSVKNDELLEGAAMLVVVRRAMTQV